MSYHPECGHTSVHFAPSPKSQTQQTNIILPRQAHGHDASPCHASRAIRSHSSAIPPIYPTFLAQMGKNSTCKVFLKQCLKNLTVGGETGQTSENTHSGYWELTRARMVILPQVEEEQGEDSVWRMFWSSDARISYRQIRRSATYLFMFLERQQSLKAFKTTKVLKPLISSHGRRHLKWCQHLSPRLPAVNY